MNVCANRLHENSFLSPSFSLLLPLRLCQPSPSFRSFVHFINTQSSFFSYFLFLNSLHLPTSLSFRLGGRIDMHDTFALNLLKIRCKVIIHKHREREKPTKPP